jgi:hypothetical protein
MAKKAAAEPKPAAPPQAEAAFVDLMLVAADFVQRSGGVEQAKKALEDAGHFIERAGSAAKASKALDVLASLREKITP